MAKTTEKPGAAELAPIEAAQERLTFRDLIYTSRTVITPDTKRELAVSKARVEVPAADVEAVDFLKANKEFELLKE